MGNCTGHRTLLVFPHSNRKFFELISIERGIHQHVINLVVTAEFISKHLHAHFQTPVPILGNLQQSAPTSFLLCCIAVQIRHCFDALLVRNVDFRNVVVARFHSYKDFDNEAHPVGSLLIHGYGFHALLHEIDTFPDVLY